MDNETTLRSLIPVFIPYFNQPTYILRFVAKLVASGFRQINILVNGEQTPGSTEALIMLSHCDGVNIFELGKNHGPRWFFTSQFFALAPRLFIYSDPDLELAEVLPDNFLTRLVEVSETLRVGKVGSAIALEPDEFRKFSKEGLDFDAFGAEARYWKLPLGDDLYAANIDTTFTLVNKDYFRLESFFVGVRIAGAWLARHLPYYTDTKMPQAEWDLYNAAKFRAEWYLEDVERVADNADFMALVGGGKEAYDAWVARMRKAATE